MPTDDNQSEEYSARLEELLDRMVQAGLIKGHAHTDQESIMSLTAEGQITVDALRRLESIGPLNSADRLLLWRLFLEARDIPPDSGQQ